MKKTISLLTLVITAVLLFGTFTYGDAQVISAGDWENGSHVIVTDQGEAGNIGEQTKSQEHQNWKEEKKECKDWCCWIKLNTNFPIIWNCIWTSKDSETNPTTAFPKMIWALTKIIMSLILVVCFIFIIVAGIMWAWSWEDNSQVTKAKWILKKVAIVILLLWFSWAILRLINPNFFG